MSGSTAFSERKSDIANSSIERSRRRKTRFSGFRRSPGARWWHGERRGRWVSGPLRLLRRLSALVRGGRGRRDRSDGLLGRRLLRRGLLLRRRLGGGLGQSRGGGGSGGLGPSRGGALCGPPCAAAGGASARRVASRSAARRRDAPLRPASASTASTGDGAGASALDLALSCPLLGQHPARPQLSLIS